MQEIHVEGRERRRLFRPNNLPTISSVIGSFLLEPVMNRAFDRLPELQIPKKRTKIITTLGLTMTRHIRSEVEDSRVYSTTTSLAIYDDERKLITLRGYSQARDEQYKLAVLRALDFYAHPDQLCWSEGKNSDLDLVCLFSTSGSSPEPSLVTVHGGSTDADGSEQLAISVVETLMDYLADDTIDMYRPRCAVDQNISDREIRFRLNV